MVLSLEGKRELGTVVDRTLKLGAAAEVSEVMRAELDKGGKRLGFDKIA